MKHSVWVRNLCMVSLIALAAGACASSSPNPDDGFSRAVNKTSTGFDDAALSPLNDLNLRRTEIPDLLSAIQSPYQPIDVLTCGAIGVKVKALTDILGPDADAPQQPDDTIDQKIGEGAADLALDSVSSVMTDFIPFRSVIRYATGATAHERALRAAYERGIQRRAYLKGVGASMGCAPPAAPDPSAGVGPTNSRIQYRGALQPSP